MKRKKFYPGILAAMVMAFLIAIPAMATENTDTGSVDNTAEFYENDEGEMDSLSGDVSEPDYGDYIIDEDGYPAVDGVDLGDEEIDDSESFEIVTLEGAADDDGSIPVTGVTLDKSNYTLAYKGQTVQLTATVSPDNATDSGVTWKSDSTSVATVEQNGKVTAVAKGTATITVTTADGSYTADCKITVDLYSDGFHKDPDGSDWYYYKNGALSTTTSVIKGTVNGTTGWWNVVKGKVTPGITVAKNSNGWWYINANGMVDFNYTGFAKNGNGSWYCENGKVTFKKQGILKDTKGGIGSKSDWYYVIESKVQTGFTGLSNFKNENGWWYISKGKVDFSHNGVDKNVNGWWYVTGGKVQFGFTGLANYKNSNGWWYIKSGKVDFSHNGVDKNVNGWWYVRDGKVIFSYNGIAQNSNGWWYIQNGKVNFNYTGQTTSSGKTYAVKSGKVTGFAAPVFTVTRGASSTTVNWNSVGAEKYRVFRKTYGGSWTKLADTSSTSYTDKTQVRGTNYYYTVRCINASGTTYTSSYISSYSGSEVVSYARQFLGNPYVWDGLSLTNGCDCSGFVAGVYGHFGVSMPHYSFKQAEAGYAVSYSNAKPGDLIFYNTSGPTGGHIGIYIGNGQMISAKSSSEGICIHSVNSSASGFTVRRIF